MQEIHTVSEIDARTYYQTIGGRKGGKTISGTLTADDWPAFRRHLVAKGLIRGSRVPLTKEQRRKLAKR